MGITLREPCSADFEKRFLNRVQTRLSQIVKKTIFFNKVQTRLNQISKKRQYLFNLDEFVVGAGEFPQGLS